jgi:cell division transport system permease protein
MAIKLSYVSRETGYNLWRNRSLTVACVATVAVSLALFGGGRLVKYTIGNATARWKHGIEFIVFMNPTASQEQLNSVERKLASNPDVRTVNFVDKAGAFEEFKQLFPDSPEMTEAVTVDAMPPSFRVAPSTSDAVLIDNLGRQFQDDPGVKEVVFAFETVRTIERFANELELIITVVSVFLMAAAALLILNTVIIAMVARRREIEVMKLVGATNWFIRVPFMVEGVVQGVIGAVLGMGATWAMKTYLNSALTNQAMPMVQSFRVADSQLFTIWGWLIVLGILVGAVGSSVAVTRYLDV